jgi:hypothetical protein
MILLLENNSTIIPPLVHVLDAFLVESVAKKRGFKDKELGVSAVDEAPNCFMKRPYNALRSTLWSISAQLAFTLLAQIN